MQTNNLNSVENQAIAPQAVIRWSRGGDAKPDIFVLADTAEEARRLEKFLEGKLLLDR